jgi:hypothetical protein
MINKDWLPEGNGELFSYANDVFRFLGLCCFIAAIGIFTGYTVFVMRYGFTIFDMR